MRLPLLRAKETILRKKLELEKAKLEHPSFYEEEKVKENIEDIRFALRVVNETIYLTHFNGDKAPLYM